MTAEIAILNKNAVALAADSAVTLPAPESPKIYNTANKVFMLSKFHPAGIMVCGSAEFMGLPWETIIKVYRSKLGMRNFDALKQFAKDFFEYLDQSRLLFSESRQRSYFQRMISRFFWHIRKDIQGNVEEALKTKSPLSDAELTAITNKVIDEWLTAFEKEDGLACFDANFGKTVSENYKEEIDKAIELVLEKLVSGKEKKNSVSSLFGVSPRIVGRILRA
jgi:hypothetical protein